MEQYASGGIPPAGGYGIPYPMHNNAYPPYNQQWQQHSLQQYSPFPPPQMDVGHPGAVFNAYPPGHPSPFPSHYPAHPMNGHPRAAPYFDHLVMQQHRQSQEAFPPSQNRFMQNPHASLALPPPPPPPPPPAQPMNGGPSDAVILHADNGQQHVRVPNQRDREPTPPSQHQSSPSNHNQSVQRQSIEDELGENWPGDICPKCNMKVHRSHADRKNHFEEHHFSYYFFKVDDWADNELGLDDDSRRACVNCFDRELFRGRAELLDHIKEVHRSEFVSLQSKYKENGGERRPLEDARVHTLLMEPAESPGRQAGGDDHSEVIERGETEQRIWLDPAIEIDGYQEARNEVRTEKEWQEIDKKEDMNFFSRNFHACPICGKDYWAATSRERKDHYRRNHYRVYYRLHSEYKCNNLEKWLLMTLSARSEANEREEPKIHWRSCIGCGTYHASRPKLLLHIKEKHPHGFVEMKVVYKKFLDNLNVVTDLEVDKIFMEESNRKQSVNSIARKRKRPEPTVPAALHPVSTDANAAERPEDIVAQLASPANSKSHGTPSYSPHPRRSAEDDVQRDDVIERGNRSRTGANDK